VYIPAGRRVRVRARSKPRGPPALKLVELPVRVPPFFLEACGYRGTARFVALRWLEDAGELWLSDDGHAVRAIAEPMVFLWRRDGGTAALERFRIEGAELGRPPWLLIDRDRHTLFLGSAAAVWRVVEGPEQRR
jgi:hypothetical protein